MSLARHRRSVFNITSNSNFHTPAAGEPERFARAASFISKLMALTATLVLFGCSVEDDRYLFRYGHSQPLQAPRSQSMVFFKNELEERTDGRIQVENYFSATLGSEREMMDMVATGALQGTRGGLFADANPKYVIFMLPFLVSNWDQATRLVSSELTRSVNEGARQRGFHIPATVLNEHEPPTRSCIGRLYGNCRRTEVSTS